MDPHPDAGPEGLTSPRAGTPGRGSAPPIPGSPGGVAGPPDAALGDPAPSDATPAGTTPPGTTPHDVTPARVRWAERGAVSPADPVELAAALAEIRAARTGLDDEAARLKAAARSAVDVREKVRRNPGKTAGVVGGAAFVALGGPGRVVRGIRRRVFGAPAPLPPSLLPEQVEKAVRALGEDGVKVRGALERGFADYLAAARKKDRGVIRRALLAAGLPIVRRVARDALKRTLSVPPAQGRPADGSESSRRPPARA